MRFSRLPTFFTLSLYCTLLALQVSGGGAVERHGRRSACLHAFVHCRGLKLCTRLLCCCARASVE